MRNTKLEYLNMLIFLIVFLILLSSVFIVRIYRSAEDTLLEEHDKHLLDIAMSVDHSVENITSKLETKVEYAISSVSVMQGEQAFINTKDTSELFSALKNSDALASTSIKEVLLLDGDTIITPDGKDPRPGYSFPAGYGDVTVCIGPDSAVYLALIMKTEKNVLSYVALVELRSFYDGLIFGTLYDEYDVMLYDRTKDIVIENIYNTPDFRLLSINTTSRRSKAYDIIRTIDETGEVGMDGYEYTNSSDESVPCRIVVIPGTISNNGRFAVSVSTDSRKVYTPLRRMEYRVLMISIILSLSITALILTIVYGSKRDKVINSRMKQLSDEKELTEKLLEQQKELAHHQKLETIGTLTSGVAHEFNNLLAPIMSNSILIIENLPPEDTATYDSALAIYDASYRAKQLVSSFSRLSRKSDAGRFTDVSLSDIITGTLNIVSSIQPKSVTVEARLADGLCLHCDEPQISHILMNLFVNAFQAMEEGGGTLTVSTGSDDESVWFSVEDTGSGIPEEHLEKIFDPFFTTKEVGKGTGLGLAIVQQTVQQYNGRVDVKSSSQGTCFTVIFPKQ